ncbi:MAG: toprim domain-containing protein [Candidatus Marinimicrobia bacterium]|nr:toprim domain-containing protein [Candidatus Neomarinimicrobiota bacterium]
MKLDYDRIKRELSIERVLQEYGMLQDLKRSGPKLSGSCPVHKGDNPSAFNVSLDKNLWNCFTNCGGGSVIDLIMVLERVNSRVAVQLGYDFLGIELTNEQSSIYSLKPLPFNLTLDPDNEYLRQRYIDPNTAREFGIGYCKNGIMSGRIAIPIHDMAGNLAAYCGRAINNTQPKYRFPRGFPKSKVVYNLNRVIDSGYDEVAVVEGFFDVFTLHKAGIESVALMGSSLSQDQKKQLLSLEQRLVLMFDGDQAGRRGMEKAISALQGKQPLKVIYLPENVQPEHLGISYLKELLPNRGNAEMSI